MEGLDNEILSAACEAHVAENRRLRAEVETLKLAQARRIVALERAWVNLDGVGFGTLVPDEYEAHGHNRDLANARELLARQPTPESEADNG